MKRFKILVLGILCFLGSNLWVEKSWAFQYSIRPLPLMNQWAQVKNAIRFSALAGFMGPACESVTLGSDFCDDQSYTGGWASPVSCAQAFCIGAAVQCAAKAIAPDFFQTLAAQLNSRVSGRSMSWEQAKKLRYVLSMDEEWRRWNRVSLDILQVVEDEVHPGELPALLDLWRFSDGGWSFTRLEPYLLAQGMDEEIWDFHQQEVRRLIRDGGPFFARQLVYNFLQEVRTAHERWSIDYRQATRVRESNGRVERLVREMLVQERLVSWVIRATHANIRYRMFRASLRASDEQYDEVFLDFDQSQFFYDRTSERERIREVLRAFQVTEGGEEFVRNPVNFVGSDQNQMENTTHLSSFEKNLLRGMPYLRELYTHGPGEEVMPVQALRKFLVGDVSRLCPSTVSFFEDESHLSALRALNTQEDKEAYILSHLEILSQAECGDLNVPQNEDESESSKIPMDQS